MLLSCKSPPVTVVLGIRPSSTRNLGFPCCNSFVLFLSNIHLCCFPSVCSLHQHSFLSPGESANGSISQARPDRCPFPGGEARGGGGGGWRGGRGGWGEISLWGGKLPFPGLGGGAPERRSRPSCPPRALAFASCHQCAGPGLPWVWAHSLGGPPTSSLLLPHRRDLKLILEGKSV